jgi:hypothetical protein
MIEASLVHAGFASVSIAYSVPRDNTVSVGKLITGRPGADSVIARVRVGTAKRSGRDRVKLLELIRGRAPARLEACGVPAGEASPGLVGALAEAQQGRSGGACCADRLVGEDRE